MSFYIVNTYKMSDALPTVEDLNKMTMTQLYAFARAHNAGIRNLLSYKKNRKDELVNLIAEAVNIANDPKFLLQERVVQLYNDLQSFSIQDQMEILAPYFVLTTHQQAVASPTPSPPPSPVEVLIPSPPPSPVEVLIPSPPPIPVEVALASPVPVEPVSVIPPVPVPVFSGDEPPRILNYSPHENNPWRKYGDRSRPSTIPINIVTYKELMSELSDANVVNPIEYIPMVERNIQKCLGLV